MIEGERILLRKSNLSGTIAYIGTIEFASGIWIGIELDVPVGKWLSSLICKCFERIHNFYKKIKRFNMFLTLQSDVCNHKTESQAKMVIWFNHLNVKWSKEVLISMNRDDIIFYSVSFIFLCNFLLTNQIYLDWRTFRLLSLRNN